MKRVIVGSLCMVASSAMMSVFGQAPTVKATRFPWSDELPSSLSVAINPKTSSNVVVSASNGKTFFTLDSGKMWAASLEAGDMMMNNPALICDPKGAFYRFGTPKPITDKTGVGPTIAPEGIAYQESKDNGISWKSLKILKTAPGMRISNPKPGVHFEWKFLYLTWTETTLGDNCQSNTFFNSSSFDGNRWKDPIKLSHLPGACIDNDSLMFSDGPVMSTEGNLFAVWFNKGTLYCDRSFDNSKTWLGYDMAVVADRKGWMRDIPGAGRVTAQPSLAVDRSASFFRTSLYVVWSDKQFDDGDVWLLRTTSRGDIWSQPIRVNQDDRGKEQFYPSIAVDQMTGIVYIVYYDRRGHEDTSDKTDVYLSYSFDGAAHFKELKLTGTPLSADPENLIRCRPSIAANNGVISVAWSGVDTDGAGVWVTVLDQKDLVTAEEVPKLQQIRKQ